MRFGLVQNLTAFAMRACSLVARFLLVIVLVKYFTPDEVGAYGLLTAQVAYVLFFWGAEYYNYVSRAVIEIPEVEQAAIIRDQFVFYGLIFLLMAPILLFLFYRNILPSHLCIWFFVIAFFEHISNELMRILIALARPYMVNMVFFIRQGLWVFVLLPIFYFFPSSHHLSVIFLSWIIGAFLSILLAAYALYHLPWKQALRMPVNWRQMFKGFRISQPFLVTAFCALSFMYLERFFVSYYSGLAAVGVYTFYSGLSTALHSFVNSGVSKMRLAFLLSAGKQNDTVLFHEETVGMLKYTVCFVLFFAVLMLILINPFLHMMNKEFYLKYVSLFYYLLFGAVCRSIADVPLYTLYAKHHDRLLLLVNLTAFCIMLLGNVILVPTYGLWGAAISSAAAGFTLLVFSLSLMIKRMFRPIMLLQP